MSTVFSKQTIGEVVVSKRSGIPGNVRQPDGMVVSYVRTGASDSTCNHVSTLRSTIEQSRLDKLGIEPSDLAVRRFNEDAGSWESLETSVVGSGNGMVVLEADAPGFSYFAATSRQVVTTTTPDDGGTATTTTSDDGTTTTGTVGFDDETSMVVSGTTGSLAPRFGTAFTVVALLTAVLLTVRWND